MQSGQVESPTQTESPVSPTPVISPEQVAARIADRGCAHPVHQLITLFAARDFITGHDFTVAHCDQCGFDVTTPQPATAEMPAYYPSGYYGAVEDRRFPQIVETLQNALYTLRVREVEMLTTHFFNKIAVRLSLI